MKIGVCIKQVPDTATKIQAKADGSGVSEDNAKYIMSPYDEFAVEEALRTKEKQAGSEVIVFSVGPKKCQEALRTALAMGADRAVHVNSEGTPLDSLGIAKQLSAQLKAEGVELVFTGRVASDLDHAQVSQMVAELLGWPHVTSVSKFELSADGKKAKAERDIDGGAKEVWEVELPGLFAATKGLNEPRYASLKGIMSAKTKPLKEMAAEKVPPVVMMSNYKNPPSRQAGKVFKDDPAKAVKEVVRLLREEAKVI